MQGLRKFMLDRSYILDQEKYIEIKSQITGIKDIKLLMKIS